MASSDFFSYEVDIWATYRLVYAYPDGSRSCPAPMQPEYRGPGDPLLKWQMDKTMPRPPDRLINGQPRALLMQRRSRLPIAGSPDWAIEQWVDELRFDDSSTNMLWGYIDRNRGFNITVHDISPAGPLAAGWRWKYGSQGTTDGYLPAAFPELTATSGRGISTTYQLVYQIFQEACDGYHSYPGMSRFTVQHAAATTPLLLYVQLASGTHPANMRALLLQRVEADALWTVASLGADSEEVRSGRTALVFRDVTSRATWDGTTPAQPPLEVEAGPLLAPLLLADRSSTSGVRVAIANHSTAALSQQHWGVAFLGPLPQFSLVDSVVEDVPLSPAAPLIECRGCEEVAFRNVTLRRLAPLAADPAAWNATGVPYNTHGAVLVSSVRRLVAEALVCTDVNGAHGFACLLVDVSQQDQTAAEPSELSFSACALRNNTVMPAFSAAQASAEPLQCLLDASAAGLEGAGAVALIGGGSSSSANLRVVDCTVSGNGGGNGAAFFSRLRMGAVELVNSHLDENVASACGGAMHLGSPSRSGSSTALLLRGGATLSGNHAASKGGAVYVAGAMDSLLIEGPGSAIDGNTVQSGGGGALYVADNLESVILRDGASLSGNAAGSVNTADGGALRVGGTVREVQVLRGSRADRNTAQSGGLLAFSWEALLPGVELTVSGHSSVSYNTAQSGGGGMSTVEYNVVHNYNYGGSLMTAGSIGAIVVSVGGSVSHNYGGPAFYSDSILGRVTVCDPGSRVANNTAVMVDGGAFSAGSLDVLEVLDGGSLLNNIALSGSGGAVGVTRDVGRITIRGGTVSGNAARKRAGAVLVGRDVTGSVEVTGGAVVEANVAGRDGGFLAVLRTLQGALAVSGAGSRVCGCSAGGSGGAVFVGGDGVFGGVAVTGGAVLCRNTAQEDGGALHLGFGATAVTIDGPGSGLLGNSAGAGHGGALYARGVVSSLEVSGGAALDDNAAGESGGAVSSALVGSLRLSANASVSRNRAGSDGGAVSLQRLTSLEVSGGSVVTGNKAGRNGGFASFATLPDNITVCGGSQLLRNTALRGAGGAINVEVPEPGSALLSQVAPAGTAVLVVSGAVRLAGNGAYTDGGAVNVGAAASPSPTSALGNAPQIAYTVLLEGVEADSNFAGGAGGLLAVSSPAAGALDSPIAVRSSRLSNNTAGSALFRLGSSVASGYGGALAVSSAPKFRADAVMEQAESGAAGAAAFAAAHGSVDSACALVLAGVSFDGNRCQGLGGAVAAVSCPTRIRNCSFTQNVARLSGGGVAGMVEAIVASSYSSSSSNARRRRRLQQQQLLLGAFASASDDAQSEWDVWLDIAGSTFNGNSAQRDCGGGAYTEVVRGAGARLADSALTGNAALDQDGGGVCVVAKGGSGASAVLERVTLRRNNARSGRGGALFASLGGGAGGRNGSLVTVTGCEFSANDAGGGGAVAVQAATVGSSLRLADSLLQGNVATQGGGAALVECDPAAANACGDAGSSADDMDAVAGAVVLAMSGCILSGNAARSGRGGALLVSAAASAAVLNTSISGGWAGDSGAGVAAVGCAALVVGAGSSISNSSALRFGGGLFAYSCSRVRVQDATVAGCLAATGAGLFLAGPSSSSSLLEPVTSGSADASGPPQRPPTAPLVLLQRTHLTGNVANRTAAAEQVAAAELDYVAKQLRLQPYASAYAALNGGAVSGSSYQRFGGHGGAVFAHGDVAVALRDVDASWSNTALVGAALASTQQCDTAAATSANSGSVFAGDNSSLWQALAGAAGNGSCWPLMLSNVALPPAQASPVWTQDVSAAALWVTCRQLQNAPGSAGCDAEPAPALRRACQLQYDLETCGSSSGSSSSSSSGLADETAAATAGLLELPPTHMRIEAVVVTDSDGQQRQLSLSGGGSSSNSSAAPAVALQLRPGSTFALSVRMYNGLGQPTLRDTLAWSVTASLEPAAPAAAAGALNATGVRNSSSRPRGKPLLPWQDAALGNLDPGAAAGSSLTADVDSGVAAWPTLTARGWTGDYVLAFDAAALEDAGLYQVEQLRLRLQLLPCAPGEALDLEWARAPWGQPSWVACSACGRGRLTLWRDSRPLLADAALAGADYYSRMKAMSEAAVEGEASCQSCPEHATCPGGAVVVPEPGFWHSAPDSAWMHRCPQQQACGDSSHLDDWPPLLAPTTVANATDAATGASAAPTADAHVVFALLSLQCGDWGPAAAAMNRSGWNASGGSSLLGSRAGYLAAQCAQGYSGNLCAACQPGYYSNAELECNTCPTQARTIGLALLAFLGSMALVLYTTYTNLRENHTSATATTGPTTADQGPPARPAAGGGKNGQDQAAAAAVPKAAAKADDLSAADVLKVLIVHIQYYIIITRLPIPYPGSITRTGAVVTAMTGAESSVAYSPSCLFPQQASAGQARTQLLAALLIPCVVVALCLGLWALRYLLLNRALLRRTRRISRRAARDASGDLPVFMDDYVRASSASRARGDGFAMYNNAAAVTYMYVAEDPDATSSATLQLPRAAVCVERSGISSAFSPVSTPITAIAVASFSGGSNHARAAPAPTEDAGGAAAADGAASPRAKREPSGSAKLRGAGSVMRSQLSGSIKSSGMARTLQHLDQRLSLPEQLGIVLMCAVFIMYPGWANAALSVFTCYRIDDGVTGPFADRQQCYSGVHMALYVPIGIAAFLLFCVAPPLASLLLLWWRRRDLDTIEVQQRFGFLYRRYKPRFYYWESVLMLQELGLVAVEVFGRSLEEVSYQVLLMLAAFIVLGVVNMACSPVRDHAIEMLEFMSLAVLSLTLTLSLYFIVGDNLQAASADAIGWVIMAINVALLVVFVVLLLRKSWAAARSKLEAPLRSARSAAARLKQRAGGARRWRGPWGTARAAAPGASSAAPPVAPAAAAEVMQAALLAHPGTALRELPTPRSRAASSNGQTAGRDAIEWDASSDPWSQARLYLQQLEAEQRGQPGWGQRVRTSAGGAGPEAGTAADGVEFMADVRSVFFWQCFEPWAAVMLTASGSSGPTNRVQLLLRALLQLAPAPVLLQALASHLSTVAPMRAAGGGGAARVTALGAEVAAAALAERFAVPGCSGIAELLTCQAAAALARRGHQAQGQDATAAHQVAPPRDSSTEVQLLRQLLLAPPDAFAAAGGSGGGGDAALSAGALAGLLVSLPDRAAGVLAGRGRSVPSGFEDGDQAEEGAAQPAGASSQGRVGSRLGLLSPAAFSWRVLLQLLEALRDPQAAAEQAIRDVHTRWQRQEQQEGAWQHEDAAQQAATGSGSSGNGSAATANGSAEPRPPRQQALDSELLRTAAGDLAGGMAATAVGLLAELTERLAMRGQAAAVADALLASCPSLAVAYELGPGESGSSTGACGSAGEAEARLREGVAAALLRVVDASPAAADKLLTALLDRAAAAAAAAAAMASAGDGAAGPGQLSPMPAVTAAGLAEAMRQRRREELVGLAPPLAPAAVAAAVAALGLLLPPAVAAHGAVSYVLADAMWLSPRRPALPYDCMQVLAAALPALYPGGSQPAAAAGALAAAWADAAAVTRMPPHRHGSLSVSLLLLLARLPGDVGTPDGAAASRGAVESTPGLLGAVLGGVSARLGSPLAGVRQAAMRVGRGLSRLLDPGADLFGDLGVDVSGLAAEELWPGALPRQLLWRSPVADAAAAAACAAEAAAAAATAGPQHHAANGKPSTAAAIAGAKPSGGAASAAAGGAAEDDDDGAASIRTTTDSDDDDELEDGSDEDDELRPLGASVEEMEGDAGADEWRRAEPAALQLRSLAAALRKQDDVSGVLKALGRLEELIRAGPEELGLAASELVRALLHCRVPEWAESEQEQEQEQEQQAPRQGQREGGGGAALQRMRCLVALLAVAPLPAGDALLPEVYSPHLDTHQRLTLLDALAAAAAELAADPRAAPRLAQGPGGRPVLERGAPAPPPAAAPALTAGGPGGALVQGGAGALGSGRGPKTRVWAPAALRKRREEEAAVAAGRQGAGPGGAHTYRNRFADVALRWAAGLLREVDRVKHGVDLLGRDHMVLGRLLAVLGGFAEAAAGSPAAPPLANATLELLRSPQVHEHPEPFVRRAALLAAGQVLGHLPPAAVAAALLGAGGAGGAGALAAGLPGGVGGDGPGSSRDGGGLGERLEWVAGWSRRVAAEDGDPHCRLMAQACVNLQSDLASRCLASLQDAASTAAGGGLGGGGGVPQILGLGQTARLLAGASEPLVLGRTNGSGGGGLSAAFVTDISA
ncbi:hypothetical protein HXX76_002577 [Chlamydomonas incerta]|uniref:TRP C-terminal domain-containing protein n=1 Tax=Chlamydomonas incerta TaxID=51695 RepID=A0A835TNY0_CHLIN|nr:hypothetical protein HXX76_002577 [Chlamydomonas incerta]|eukprot:KAG2442491.1 hypothetical protein HXX76_002577 [Chlamydomonas incerta]